MEYLAQRYPAGMPVKEALVRAIKERRPDPRSEESEWWNLMKHVVPELERFAYLYTHGLIQPMSEAVLDEEGPVVDAPSAEAAITWPVPELRA